jgi:hypothetical protein
MKLWTLQDGLFVSAIGLIAAHAVEVGFTQVHQFYRDP